MTSYCDPSRVSIESPVPSFPPNDIPKCSYKGGPYLIS